MKLNTPIQRGETSIDGLVIRKPTAGELRGVALVDLLQMDVTALITVLPRITEPSLTGVEVSGMDIADLMQAGAQVSGFLLGNKAPSQPA